MINKKLNISSVFVSLWTFAVAILLCEYVYAANIWEKRQKALENVLEAKEKGVVSNKISPEAEISESIDPSEIVIPEEYGTIIEKHKGTNGKFIVHIQDVHANYEGQMNIANILESLVKAYNLDLILKEGKLTDRDFKYLRERAPSERRRQVADDLVKAGYFSGVGYLDLSSDYPLKIRGLEKKELYDSHVDSLWEIDKFKDIAADYVDKLIIACNGLKSRIYNKDLKELDKKIADYEKENIDIMAYYDYLHKKAIEVDAPLYVFPNFNDLIKASELEKKIDFVKIRDGSALSKEKELYDEYVELTNALNINALFKEESMLVDYLEDIFVENSEQRNLLKISKALSIMKKFLGIKAIPEEYTYFKENKKDFDARFWTNFIKAKSQALNLPLNIPDNFYIINDNLPKIEKFYRLASERDKVFLERTREHLKNEGETLAALVAGGFHTPTLTKLLADAGYSYIVVSPKVTTKTDDEFYRSALRREWIPEVEGEGL